MGKKKQPKTREVKKKWYDVFNGHVSSPGEFILIYVMIGAISIGAMIMLAVASTPKAAEDLTYKTLSFERYEVQDKNLRLYAENEPYYTIPAYGELMTNPEVFTSAVADGTTFVVGYEYYDEADIPYYGIESIVGTDGVVYLSMDEVHEYRWGEATIAVAVFGFLTVFWIIYVALSIYVGRNPDKFSRKTIRLFFKDGYCHRTPKR